ncbi:MAG: TIGR01212 family radical SAM protein [Candidatus Omnitrophica bacterium]|nr:TIGR01212 family radical SAM protein [Candidatus Omnitrophota bacterium]
MKERFHSFNSYLQNIFGERVQRISLDAGFGCPNIDGTLSTQGCIYCNNKGFSKFARSNLPLEDQIANSVEFYKKRLGANKFIAYFQSFTNTYADQETLSKRYDLIRKFPQIVGLFISTRPDCVNEEKMKLIASYKKDYLVWVEYGLQTTQEPILRLINRNHSYEDFLGAYKLARDYEINVGVHLIMGLPTSSYENVIEDANRLAKLDIQGIKFHIFHLLRGTQLELLHKKNNFNFLTQDEYVKNICDFLELMPTSLVVLRLISNAHPDYLIAPSWINNKHAVIEQIRKELENRGTRQGYRYESVCS